MDRIEHFKALAQSHTIELHRRIQLLELIAEYEHERASISSRDLVWDKIIEWSKELIREHSEKNKDKTNKEFNDFVIYGVHTDNNG